MYPYSACNTVELGNLDHLHTKVVLILKQYNIAYIAPKCDFQSPNK